MVTKQIQLLSLIQRVLDLTVIAGLFGVFLYLRDVEFDAEYQRLIVWVLIGFSVLAHLRSLYSTLKFSSFTNDIANVLLVWLSISFLLETVLFATKQSESFSRLVLFSWLISVPVVLIVLRYILLKLSFANGKTKIKVAIFGSGTSTAPFLNYLHQLQWPWFEIVGVYDDRSEALYLECQHQCYRLGSTVQMLEAVKNGGIDLVYITVSMLDEGGVEELLNVLADSTVTVYLVPDIYLSDLMRSRWVKLGEYTVVSIYDTPFMGIFGWVKRSTDVVLASVILLIIWPIMLVIAVLIKLTSKGPVLFKQRRYGLNGESINVYKFRSMTVTENGNHIPQAQRNDPRTTSLGRFLRATSLDELPQFFNVLKGEMSVVGPRPHANAHNEEYRKRIRGYMLRHKVKPGITGWAQVNGWRGETDTLEKMEKRIEYDLDYIQRWSVWLDLKIVLLTIQKGFINKNAY